jgi:hypothetical protein
VEYQYPDQSDPDTQIFVGILAQSRDSRITNSTDRELL